MTKTNPTRRALKEQRFRTKQALLHIRKQNTSGLTAEQVCGCAPMGTNDRHIGFPLTTYKNGRKRARFTNIQRSNSYTCPDANYRKQLQRTGESAHLVKEHYASGGYVVFVTMTMATTFTPTPDFFYSAEEAFRRAYKDRKNPIPGISPTLSFPKAKAAGFATWQAQNPQPDSTQEWSLTQRFIAQNDTLETMFDASKNKGWKQLRETLEYAGRILAIETVSTPKEYTRRDGSTFTSWKYAKHNVHFHSLLFFDREPTEAELTDLKANLFAWWNKGIKRHGFTASLGAQDVRLIPTAEDAARVAEYVSKLGNTAWTLRNDGTDDDSIQEQGYGFYAPLFAAAHDRYAALTWQNIETTFAGSRLFRITNDLRDRYDLKGYTAALLEARKAEIEEVTQLCYFDRETWSEVLRLSPQFRIELQELAELEGAHGVRELLDDLGITYHLTNGSNGEAAVVPAPAPAAPHPVWRTDLPSTSAAVTSTEGVLV